jgi:hypothetical protein
MQTADCKGIRHYFSMDVEPASVHHSFAGAGFANKVEPEPHQNVAAPAHYISARG